MFSHQWKVRNGQYLLSAEIFSVLPFVPPSVLMHHLIILLILGFYAEMPSANDLTHWNHYCLSDRDM